MTDLSGVPTDSLVEELVKREGVQCMKNVPGYKFKNAETTIIIVQGVD